MQDLTCGVEGCPRAYSRGGYCNGHYLQVRRNGAPSSRRQCKVDGCTNRLTGTQHLCAAHRLDCVEPDCVERRAGRSSRCKTHKNYRAAPLPAPSGSRVCRRCRSCRPTDEFYARHDWCKACFGKYRVATRARMRTWRVANAERLRAHRRCYEPRMRELVNTRNAEIRARRVPFTTEQIEARFAYYGHRCWICRAPAEHADHVKPISAGGWHMLANLRPACARCNHRKNKTWPLTASVLERIRAA